MDMSICTLIKSVKWIIGTTCVIFVFVHGFVITSVVGSVQVVYTHFNCIVARCLINVDYLMAGAYIRS